jgi:hypothetical protein
MKRNSLLVVGREELHAIGLAAVRAPLADMTRNGVHVEDLTRTTHEERDDELANALMNRQHAHLSRPVGLIQCALGEDVVVGAVRDVRGRRARLDRHPSEWRARRTRLQRVTSGRTRRVGRG